MTGDIMQAYGVIVDYFIGENTNTLSILASIKVNGCDNLMTYTILAEGHKYNMFCNDLCLYQKNGMINLNFLLETFISADIAEEAGTYKIKRMEIDLFRYI